MFGKLTLLILFFSLTQLSACDQTKDLTNQQTSFDEGKLGPYRYPKPHAYGGWFCPDNFGFTPVDIQELDKVPVINGRLPTLEETQNGTSLMYFDKTEHPSAKILDMKMPRVGKVYSKHSGMTELVIVIQGAIIGGDSVVGFRYPSGGNGSAWLGEVNFLSDEEVKELGPSPFIYSKTTINSSTDRVWKAFSQTTYAKELGEKFNKKAFFESSWTNDSQAHLNLEADDVKAKGIITNLWGNLYLQIDYDIKGKHYVEKMMISEQEGNKAEVHFVSGPYSKNFEKHDTEWKRWIMEMNSASEIK